MNPYGEHYYDGISLNPFEVLFVKTKGVLLGNDWSYSTLATKYDQWMSAKVCTLQQTAHNVLCLYYCAVHRLGKDVGTPACISSGCLLCLALPPSMRTAANTLPMLLDSAAPPGKVQKMLSVLDL